MWIVEKVHDTEHIASSRGDFGPILLNLLRALVTQELTNLLVCRLKAIAGYEINKRTPVIVSQSFQL